jgi:hypothetical protein
MQTDNEGMLEKAMKVSGVNSSFNFTFIRKHNTIITAKHLIENHKLTPHA